MKTLALRSGILEEDYELLQDPEFEDEVEEVYTTLWKPAYQVWLLPVTQNPHLADEYWARVDQFELNNSRELKILNPLLKALYRGLKVEINAVKKSRKRVNSRSKGTSLRDST